MSQIKAEHIHSVGTDLTVVNAARVSFNKQSDWDHCPPYNDEYILRETDTKLINYLDQHKHLSPFGHCFSTFRVTAPVFVRAQLVKHEYLRVNEVSRRYDDSEPEFYSPDVWRDRAKNKKQGSGEGIVREVTFPDIGVPPQQAYEDVYSFALETYQAMINSNVAPELARMVLPQSMMTSWYWSGSLDAFAHMYNLRSHNDAQYETRLVAEQVSSFMEKSFPVSWPALIRSGC